MKLSSNTGGELQKTQLEVGAEDRLMHNGVVLHYPYTANLPHRSASLLILVL